MYQASKLMGLRFQSSTSNFFLPALDIRVALSLSVFIFSGEIINRRPSVMSAAEGIAGLALSAVSVAALFTTCIQCFDIIVAGRDFGIDYELLVTQLDVQTSPFLAVG